MSSSLAQARSILSGAGVKEPAALGLDETGDDCRTPSDVLGVSLSEHQSWMRSAPAAELRSWAREWVKA